MLSPTNIKSHAASALALCLSLAAPLCSVRAQSATGQRPGDAAWANYDFVPGARVLFADDFSRDRVGNFPQRLTLQDGTLEVVEWKSARWLRSVSNGVFSVNLLEVLPARFTIEFDLTIPSNGFWVYGEPYNSSFGEDAAPHSSLFLSATEATFYRGNNQGQSSVDPRTTFPELQAEYETSGLSHPVRVRIQGDGPYIKVYLDEQRIVNMPNADFARTKTIFFRVSEQSFDGKAEGVMFGNLSVNAGGRPLYEALAADGRVATQGILFATGSDRIRPESTPTLGEIVAMLKEHADLRLMIEGHTDNVGQAAANQSLSEKRAAAVKAYLVEQGIVDARLESKGFGDTKPKAGNETPEGRQTNRRVELVKI